MSPKNDYRRRLFAFEGLGREYIKILGSSNPGPANSICSIMVGLYLMRSYLVELIRNRTGGEVSSQMFIVSEHVYGISLKDMTEIEYPDTER